MCRCCTERGEGRAEVMIALLTPGRSGRPLPVLGIDQASVTKYCPFVDFCVSRCEGDMKETFKLTFLGIRIRFSLLP